MRAPQPGEAYWVDGVPPLDGGEPKRRPVIVLDSSVLPVIDPLHEITVATTTGDQPDDDAVKIEYGLPAACWAVPRWILVIHRQRLGAYAGKVEAAVLERIMEAVLDRLDCDG